MKRCLALHKVIIIYLTVTNDINQSFKLYQKWIINPYTTVHTLICNCLAGHATVRLRELCVLVSSIPDHRFFYPGWSRCPYGLNFHYMKVSLWFHNFFWNRLPMNLCNELLCFSFPLFCRFLKTMLFDCGVMTNTHQLSGQKWPWTVFPLMPRRPNFLVWSPLTMSCGYIQNSKSQCGYKCSFWTLMETLPLISFSWRGAI